MEKQRAIPIGYMRIGEIAKKAGVTVRTLKYYDEEGLLPPSAESEGGYRLYTNKDMVKLLQILMMKDLGLSLGDIKKRLTGLDAPEDVRAMLMEQSAHVRQKIEFLTDSLNAMESLDAEIAKIEKVNFKKYADILLNLQMKNERYWMIKHFDDDALELFQARIGREKTALITVKLNERLKEAIEHLEDNILPESEAGQQYAAKFWETLMELTGGDSEMMLKLNEQIEKASSFNSEFENERKAAKQFIQQALEIYLANIGGMPND